MGTFGGQLPSVQEVVSGTLARSPGAGPPKTWPKSAAHGSDSDDKRCLTPSDAAKTHMTRSQAGWAESGPTGSGPRNGPPSRQVAPLAPRFIQVRFLRSMRAHLFRLGPSLPNLPLGPSSRVAPQTHPLFGQIGLTQGASGVAALRMVRPALAPPRPARVCNSPTLR